MRLPEVEKKGVDCVALCLTEHDSATEPKIRRANALGAAYVESREQIFM